MLNKNKKRIAWNKGIKTGLKPWLGKKRPDIAEKQRIRMTGTKHTLEEIKKISDSNTGEKSSQWKGGISKDRDYIRSYINNYIKVKKEVKAGRNKPDNCELCGAMGRICFDHNHSTGKFRGWICHRCNTALGMVKDNSELLLKMSEYVKIKG